MSWFILWITVLGFDGTATLTHGPGISVSAGKVSFYADFALFPVTDSLKKLEVYYLVDLMSLSENEREKGREARYRVEVELTSKGGDKKPLKDQWVKAARKTAFTQFTVDAFSLIMLPGDYNLKMTIVDLNTKESGTIEKDFRIVKEGATLYISDIELARTINQDTLYPSFVKYGLNVVPNPLARYSPLRDTLYFFTVIDNLSPEANYTFAYAIYDSVGELVRVVSPQVKVCPGKRVLETGGLVLGDLPRGVYRLKLEVVDLGTRRRATQEKPFLYAPKEQTTMTPELQEIVGFIDYFASQKEMNIYKALSQEEKNQFLRRFWKKMDPTPETRENEFLNVFVQRVRHADREYSSPYRKGRYTDRGRIYIKYGPPDVVRRKSVAWGSRDQERWTYYSEGGIQFIFVDVDGTGDYRLMWTNARDESVDPNWRNYIDPNQIEMEEEWEEW